MGTPKYNPILCVILIIMHILAHKAHLKNIKYMYS